MTRNQFLSLGAVLPFVRALLAAKEPQAINFVQGEDVPPYKVVGRIDVYDYQDVGDGFKRQIPEGGFTIYAAGTEFKTISNGV